MAENQQEEKSGRNKKDDKRTSRGKTSYSGSLVERIPPQDTEVESAILGFMLTDKVALAKGIELLSPESFYRSAHKEIFSAATDLFESSKEVNVMTIKDKLEENGTLEEIGGAYHLANIIEDVISPEKIGSYIEIVNDKSHKRKIINICLEGISTAYESSGGFKKIAEMIENGIFDVLTASEIRAFRHVGAILPENFEALDEMHRRKDKSLTGIPSGFKHLDQITSGFQKSDLIIIAARPSVGKTSLALDLAINSGVPTGIFSIEMSATQLVNRLICNIAKIDALKLRSGRLADHDFARIASKVAAIDRLLIYIDDSAAITSTEIRTKARRLKMEHNIGLFIIDYLQLVRGGAERRFNRQEEVTEISRSFKILAKELNVPVIALSQLSREVEKRKEKRPILSDLRESGAIEQDADIVMFIYRPEQSAEEEGLSEIIIAKQRNGPTGSINLFFHKTYTSFCELETTRDFEFEDGVPF